MAAINRFFKKLGDILDDVLAYILTVVGILFSNAIPMFKSGEAIVIDLGIIRIIVAMIIAILFVSDQENLGKTEGETRAIVKQGRRKNFRKRMANALAQGVMWSYFLNNV